MCERYHIRYNFSTLKWTRGGRSACAGLCVRFRARSLKTRLLTGYIAHERRMPRHSREGGNPVRRLRGGVCVLDSHFRGNDTMEMQDERTWAGSILHSESSSAARTAAPNNGRGFLHCSDAQRIRLSRCGNGQSHHSTGHRRFSWGRVDRETVVDETQDVSRAGLRGKQEGHRE